MSMAANVKAPAMPCAAVVCRNILSRWPMVLLLTSVVVETFSVVVGNGVVDPFTAGTGVALAMSAMEHFSCGFFWCSDIFVLFIRCHLQNGTNVLRVDRG